MEQYDWLQNGFFYLSCFALLYFQYFFSWEFQGGWKMTWLLALHYHFLFLLGEFPRGQVSRATSNPLTRNLASRELHLVAIFFLVRKSHLFHYTLVVKGSQYDCIMIVLWLCLGHLKLCQRWFKFSGLMSMCNRHDHFTSRNKLSQWHENGAHLAILTIGALTLLTLYQTIQPTIKSYDMCPIVIIREKCQVFWNGQLTLSRWSFQHSLSGEDFIGDVIGA